MTLTAEDRRREELRFQAALERDWKQMLKTHVCAECGQPLVMPHDPETGGIILACGTDRGHEGFRTRGKTRHVGFGAMAYVGPEFAAPTVSALRYVEALYDRQFRLIYDAQLSPQQRFLCEWQLQGIASAWQASHRRRETNRPPPARTPLEWRDTFMETGQQQVWDCFVRHQAEKGVQGMEQGLTPHQQQALAPYYGVHSLTQEQATTVLRTIWPKAPDIEVLKAATLCKDYGLHPLMKHVFLLPFKNKRTNTVTWSVALGITATRLIASRRRPYAYIDGPRLMTEEEQKKILGEVDQDNLWAITVVQDKLGGQAPGYGKWPKDEEPQGTAKGNSKANMAWIRSERAALGRLLPGEMPGGVDVIDPSFVDSLPNDTIEGEARELPPDEGAEPEQGPPSEGDLQTATARQVDEETGEVTQPSSDDGEGPQRPPSDLKMESLGDLFNASHEYFGTTKAGVLKLLNVRDTSEVADVKDAWATVCAHKLEPRE